MPRRPRAGSTPAEGHDRRLLAIGREVRERGVRHRVSRPSGGRRRRRRPALRSGGPRTSRCPAGRRGTGPPRPREAICQIGSLGHLGGHVGLGVVGAGVEEGGVAHGRHPLDVGLAQAVRRRRPRRSTRSSARALAQLTQERALTEGADRDVAAVDVAVEVDELVVASAPAMACLASSGTWLELAGDRVGRVLAGRARWR